MLMAREFFADDRQQVLDMAREIHTSDSNFEGLDNFSHIENFDAFLIKLERSKHQEFLRPELVPQTTFGVFESGQLVGGFNLRHELRGTLFHHGGNIGYLIRPSQRQKGYGTALLALALEEARKIGLKKVLVSCRTANTASARVIEKNHGIRDTDYYDTATETTFKRYWINLI